MGTTPRNPATPAMLAASRCWKIGRHEGRGVAAMGGLAASAPFAAPLGFSPAQTVISAPRAGATSKAAGGSTSAAETMVVDGSSMLGRGFDLAREFREAKQRRLNNQVRASGPDSDVQHRPRENSTARIEMRESSRPIVQKEKKQAAALKIEPVELRTAIEGTVPAAILKSDFVATLTRAGLGFEGPAVAARRADERLCGAVDPDI